MTRTLLLLAALTVTAHAQTRDYLAAGAPLTAMPADPKIAAALKQVSPDKIRANIEALVAFHNRATVSSLDTDLPPGTGILAAADWIKAKFDSYSKDCNGCLDVKVDAWIEPVAPGLNGGPSRLSKPTPMRNVYAILHGADPAQAKRIYLVTGHYDTRETNVMETHAPAPGANDDTSGTAVSLESARVLSQLKFPATLIFVTVCGEEQGLNGSKHLAELAKSEGWQLEGVLNNDIVGGDTTPGDTLQNKSLVRVFSTGILPSTPLETIRQLLTYGLENDTTGRELARTILDVDRTYFTSPAAPKTASPFKPFQPMMELRLDRYGRGGDHRSFSEAGFPAVRFTEWRENFNHQHQHVRTENGIEYGDLLKFDDFAYIAQVARLNMATLATLAQSPGVPRNVVFSNGTFADGNASIIKWDAPSAAGTAPIRYQVLWRETAASDWQYVAEASRYGATPANNTITIPVSKDNVLFGVRACDTASHCGPAAPPLPQTRPPR
jgi:hypothetical protein